MIAAHLVEEVRRLGGHIRSEGTTLRVGPRDVIGPNLVDEIRREKEEIVRLLSERRAPSESSGDGCLWPPFAATLLGIDAERLRDVTTPVRVLSPVLDSTVVLALDYAVVACERGEVVYRPAELLAVRGIGPADFIELHRAKRQHGITLREQ